MRCPDNRNEIKLSFKEPKYNIDLANKVVVCTLEAIPQYPESVYSTLSTLTDYTIHEMNCIKTKAIARLSPEDNFDENIGMKVALAKAENKAYTTLCLMLKSYMVGINKVIEKTSDFFFKSANVIEHNDDYLARF